MFGFAKKLSRLLPAQSTLPGRAAKMARHTDHVLALLPFEPPYMEAAGMEADFVDELKGIFPGSGAASSAPHSPTARRRFHISSRSVPSCSCRRIPKTSPVP